MINSGRIKIQFVRPEQKISRQSLSGYREVRLVTAIKDHGVRVTYFDGGVEWFRSDTLVHVLRSPAFSSSVSSDAGAPARDIPSSARQTSGFLHRIFARMLDGLRRDSRHLGHT